MRKAPVALMPSPACWSPAEDLGLPAAHQQRSWGRDAEPGFGKELDETARELTLSALGLCRSFARQQHMVVPSSGINAIRRGNEMQLLSLSITSINIK